MNVMFCVIGDESFGFEMEMLVVVELVVVGWMFVMLNDSGRFLCLVVFFSLWLVMCVLVFLMLFLIRLFLFVNDMLGLVRLLSRLVNWVVVGMLGVDVGFNGSGVLKMIGCIWYMIGLLVMIEVILVVVVLIVVVVVRFVVIDFIIFMVVFFCLFVC